MTLTLLVFPGLGGKGVMYFMQVERECAYLCVAGNGGHKHLCLGWGEVAEATFGGTLGAGLPAVLGTCIIQT